MKNLVPYVVSRLATANETPLPMRSFIFVEDFVVCGFCGDGMASVSLWSPKLSWHSSVEWPIDGDDMITNLHFDSLDSKIVVAMYKGDFVEVHDGAATVVGSLDDGNILACEWSPGGDLALVVCSSRNVYILSTDFDLGDGVVVGKHQLSTADHELAEAHVSVGWGKRETQFQGRGARRDPTTQTVAETRTPGAPRSTNAPDLTYSTEPSTEPSAGPATEPSAGPFTELSAEPMANAGADTSVGAAAEPTLDAVSVSWRGDGSAVAVNATVSGEVALRIFSAEARLESVSEPASFLLKVVAYEPRGALIATVRTDGYLQFFERNGLKRYAVPIENAAEVTKLAWSADSSVLAIAYGEHVDLWTQKNWHWYRKQRINCEVSDLLWHPELPRTLGIATADEIQFSTWQLATASDDGLVAVIDRNEVKVTPLACAGIPPPMAFASFGFDAQPVAVAVRAPNTVAVALPTEVVVLSLDLSAASLKITATHEVPDAQLLTYSGALLLGYVPKLNEIMDIASATPTGLQPTAPVSVLKGAHYLCGSTLYGPEGASEFGEPCTDFVATGAESFALARSGKLLHATPHSPVRVLAHGVTSLLAGPNHLLFTTLTTLQFVHYNGEWDTERSGEQSREIERGSLLVSLMPEQMAVVLQAARGNIETIYPRMLVLGAVRASVAALDYASAFRACKSHRIDMNLLHDLNPAQFRENIPAFVTQLGPDMDLFLSALSDEDVTVTKYVDTKVGAGDVEPKSEVPGKANGILELMLPFLSPASQITALAMKRPAELVGALAKASKSTELVKHLVFLSDADLLYRTALSSYEPRLALVVAQQAQMDPKEYLPFLRARDSESGPRSRFNIDVFLKRMDRAVEHLIADTDASNSEIAEFVIKHDLHAKAVKLLRSSSGTRRDDAVRAILLSQAEIWLTQSRYVEAGTNFELLGEVTRACDAYVQGCNWRRALGLSLEPALNRKEVAARLVETCEANKLYGDAAHLLLHYLNEPRRALELYCLGNAFDSAVLVAAMHPDLREELGDNLRESFGQFQELLADCNAQIPSQLRRLRAVREKRHEDMQGFDKLAEQLDASGLDDTLSLAGTDASGTTNASAYTRYTDKSSVGTAASNATRRTLKNQRRQDRKRARGKKGSVYEEDYLIASTGRLVDRLSSTRAELQELVTALLRCDLGVYAVQLTTAYDQVLALLAEHVDEIFSVDEEALVRFDDSGHEYIASKPVKPELPVPLDE